MADGPNQVDIGGNSAPLTIDRQLKDKSCQIDDAFAPEMLCRDRKGVLRYSENALWVSTRCQPQSVNYIRQKFRSFKKERFGEPVNPHAFRYSGVTTIAIYAPELMHSVQVVVGHEPGSSVTTDNYNKAGSYSVSLEWNSIAEEIRERGLARRRLAGRRRRRR